MCMVKRVRPMRPVLVLLLKNVKQKVLKEFYHDLNWYINLNQTQCSGMFIWMNLGHVC
jgi:hypothetical protein